MVIIIKKKLVDPNKLCMGCMSIINNPSEVCPHCGFHISLYKPPAGSLSLYEILNGKYLIGKSIGTGGFGITYIAWDFYQSKKVCVKEYFPKGIAARQGSLRVHAQSTEYAKKAYVTGLQIYIKEAENLSRFYMMPGIVSVRDFFTANNTAYIVMEYIDGIDMRRYAKARGGKIPPAELFKILSTPIKALYEVHKENIIHQDISPDNIMITKTGQAKLIDFGAAKDYSATRDGMVFLKHGYAPIEQYNTNRKNGPYTDIYSLCATIYYLLTGVRIQRSTERQEKDEVKNLRNMGVSVSVEQAAAIQKGLSIHPQNRYVNVSHLYRDLYGEYID